MDSELCGVRSFTRARLLALAGVGAAALAFPGALSGLARAAEGEPVRRFVSRPDLVPPAIDVSTTLPTAAPGYVFLAPFTGPSQLGPLVVDDSGEPVWFQPVPETSNMAVHDFRVQTYRGRPVLTWWEGTFEAGYGRGECVVVDDSYREIARFGAGNGLSADLHEFTITSRDTALVTAYVGVPSDLSAAGGPVDGTLLEGVVQEIHIASGAVLFEWHSSEHVGLEESNLPSTAGLWDYFHLNSVDLLDDDDLLVSARHTCAVYKLDRDTGEIVWRLGGKRSDFAMGPGTSFAFQHDARAHGPSVVSIFDDGAYSPQSAIEPVSRAIVIELDLDAMTARLASAYANPAGALTYAMGNAQELSDGGTFVGWGTTPQFTEFAPDGSVRFDATFAGGGSYRAYRAQWTGEPSAPPSLAVVRNGDGSAQAYVSWNGATRVSHWQLLGGPGHTALKSLHTVVRTGFETSIRVKEAHPFLAAVALDGRSRALAATRVVRV